MPGSNVKTIITLTAIPSGGTKVIKVASRAGIGNRAICATRGLVFMISNGWIGY